MKRSFKYLLIFFGYQFVVTLPVVAISAIRSLIDHSVKTETSPVMLSVALLISSILTIWHFIHFKDFTIDKRTFSPISFRVTLETLIAGVAAIVVLGWLGDVMQLPDLMQDTFGKMDNVVGMLAIGLVGPVAEEIVFRGAIEGHLLKKWKNPKWAILVSALLFGAIHFNPAQIPFAFLIGLLLGWLYYRSGSLLLVIIIHVLNNSLSVWMSHLYSEEVTLTGLIGRPAVYIVVAGAAACLVLSLWRLKQMLPRPERKTVAEAGQNS